MVKVKDCQFFSPFVSPNLCKDLLDAGFNVPSKFEWRVYNDDLVLFTGSFDPDNYYTAGYNYIDAICPPLSVVRAFSFTDCEKHLPPYMLTREDNQRDQYSLGLNSLYKEVEISKDERLPDVFAKMLLQAIQRNVVDINTIMANITA